MTIGRTLDLGCGGNKRHGAVGVDIHPGPGVDVVCNLDHYPWPFADATFDAVTCFHVLEHLENIVAAMEEIYRVCRPGAEVTLEVPHFSNAYAYGDPTHRHFLSSRCLDRFVQDHPGYDFRQRCRFALVSRRLTFAGINRYLVEPWANRWLNSFERKLAFLLPGQYLHFVLRVEKPPPLSPPSPTPGAPRHCPR